MSKDHIIFLLYIIMLCIFLQIGAKPGIMEGLKNQSVKGTEVYLESILIS